MDSSCLDDAGGNSFQGISDKSTANLEVQMQNPPLITGPSRWAGSSSSNVSIEENTKLVHTFSANEPVSWRIFGGSDYKLFDIDSNTGKLTFKNAPDYENPEFNRHGGKSNTYSVNIGAYDLSNNHSSQLVSIQVTDVDEVAPTITGPSSGSVNENSTTVHKFSANETVTWSLNGGADASKFNINSSTGALHLNLLLIMKVQRFWK